MRYVFRILTIFFVLSALLSCAVNPVTGKKELSIISPSQEVSIGVKNYIPYQQQQGGRYVVDPDLGRYVNDVGQKLAALSDRPGLPYEFVVLNNSVPNAWALPGGKIAINRGLLIELEDEAQLAAVLGHEIVHVAGKHTVQKMQQSQLLGLGVLATALLTQNKDYGKEVTLGAGLGAGLWSAKYGREQELQSDAFGMKYMAKAGYEPHAAIELQETFLRLSQQRKQSSWLQGLFASHPPSQERVNKNRQTATQFNATGLRNKSVFQRAIRQLKKDQKAYDLHDKAIGEVKQKNFSSAISALNNAITIQPEESLFYVTLGQIYLSQNKDSRAASAFTQAKAKNPDYFMGHLGLGLIEKSQKRMAQAKQSFLTSQKLLPTQLATFHLGEIALHEGDKRTAIKYFSSAAQQGGDVGQQAQTHLDALQPPPQPSSN